MTPSPQQQAVIDFVANERGSAFVEAVAGFGKTTTLVAALAEAKGSVGFVAYNTKIVADIKAKVAPLNLGNRVRVGTFHSFGLNTWRQAYKNVKCGPEAALEKAQMTVGYLKLNDPTSRKYQLRDFVPNLISLAKQRALGLHGSLDDTSEWYKIVEHFDLAYELEDEGLVPEGVDLAIEGLKFHQRAAPDIIDFDDMIYMPIVSGIKVWRNDVVFVDEAQDTNPARRAYVRKMIGNYGRAIFVGDRHQAIYGFTGADNDAVDQIIRDFRCKQLPLTITYRCPKAVVAKAQEIVSHIQAHESAPEGLVHRIDYNNFLELARPDEAMRHLQSTDAILCRKTKPLVTLAFSLIRAGVPCHVEGRDIGAGLVALLKRFQNARTLVAMLDRMKAYGERQCEKLKAKGKNAQAESLADRIETVVVIAKGSNTVQEVKDKIHDLFQDGEHERKPSLTLSTVHKSKGREWPRVFVLGENVWMPGPWARQTWEVDQEMNLIYVAYTRSQNELVLIDMPPDAL